MKNAALKVAGIIFLFVSIMHLARFFWKIPVSVSGIQVPLYLSGIGFMIALLLAIWMLAANKKH